MKPLGGGWTGRNAQPEWEPTRNPPLSGPRAAWSPAPPQPGSPCRLPWDPHEKPRRRDSLSEALLCGPRGKPVTHPRASLHAVDDVGTARQPDPHLRPRHVVFHDPPITDQPSICSLFSSVATEAHRSADGCMQQCLTLLGPRMLIDLAINPASHGLQGTPHSQQVLFSCSIPTEENQQETPQLPLSPKARPTS